MRDRKVLYFCFVVIIIEGAVSAQISGNPVEAINKREWTVGLSGNYINQQMEYTTAVSKRILVKSAWGIEDWLNIYGLFGSVQLSMNRNVPGIRDYKDKSRMGYGLGANVQFDLNPEVENGIGLWGGIQFLKYVSEGTFNKTAQSNGGDVLHEFAMKYDCGEMTVCAGWIIPIKSVRLYGGGAGWAIQRTDRKKEYLVENDGSKRYIGEQKGEYQSDFWTGAVVGVEFLLPQRYFFTVEGIVFNEQNYQIRIGICQTGSPEW